MFPTPPRFSAMLLSNRHWDMLHDSEVLRDKPNIAGERGGAAIADPSCDQRVIPDACLARGSAMTLRQSYGRQQVIGMVLYFPILAQESASALATLDFYNFGLQEIQECMASSPAVRENLTSLADCLLAAYQTGHEYTSARSTAVFNALHGSISAPAGFVAEFMKVVTIGGPQHAFQLRIAGQPPLSRAAFEGGGP